VTFKRVLTQDCMACNRPCGFEMCWMCAELEAAEETPVEREREDTTDYAHHGD